MEFSSRSRTLIARIVIVVLLGLPLSGFADQNAHFGLHFVDATVEIEAYLFIEFANGGAQFDNMFHPVLMTDPGREAVQDGGLVGWTEGEFREAVVVAVERAFRAVETGDPDRTLRIMLHEGPAPTDLPGRHLNVVLGANDNDSNVLGLAYDNVFDDPGTDDHAYRAAVILNNLDELIGVDFPTAEAVINNVAGTTAHEIGHNLGLPHVDRGEEQPLPLMATGGDPDHDPLFNGDRIHERRFIPAHESLLTTVIGTVHRADFDMDEDVDIIENDNDLTSDFNILFTNVGMTGIALMRHGDADNDHDVDIVDVGDGESDFNILLANVGIGLNGMSADQSTDNADGTGNVELVYDLVTGEVWIENAGGFESVGFGSTGNVLPGNEDADGYGGGNSFLKNNNEVLFFGVEGITAEDSVGLMLVPGLDASDIGVFGQNQGQNQVQGVITVIPEPSAVALMAIGGLALLRRRG